MIKIIKIEGDLFDIIFITKIYSKFLGPISLKMNLINKMKLNYRIMSEKLELKYRRQV